MMKGNRVSRNESGTNFTVEDAQDLHDSCPQEKVVRILVVDDHPITRAGLSAILQAKPFYQVCGECGTAHEAVVLFKELRPEVTLMDLKLPDGYGVDAIREIRKCDPCAKILVVTTYEGDEDIHQSLQAGALGYLVKGSSREVIYRAMRRVQQGRIFLPEPASHALESYNCNRLTERERQVLSLMVAGKSNREIGETLNIKETSVKSHVTLILSRLQVTDRTQAVITALKRGMEHL
jgi:DNA-binding NarL/FixJ family response regulator